MTEIDYIKSELDRIENIEEENEKYFRLSIFVDKGARKYKKELLKSHLPEMKNLKKRAVKCRKTLIHNESLIIIELHSKNLSAERKQTLEEKLEEIGKSFLELDEIENDLDVILKESLKISRTITFYETNILFTIIFFVLGIASWFIVYEARTWGVDYVGIFSTVSLGTIALFIGWKIFYLGYYCKQIEATKQIVIIIYSLKLTNAFLLALIPYYALCSYINANQYFYSVPILIFSSIKTSACIYDFCSASKFFDSVENIITLFISVLFAITIAFSVVDNWVVLLIIKMLVLIISLLLTILMLKKCMLDKIKLDTFESIYTFVVLLLATIVVTCFAIYLFTWNKKGDSNQTLFSSAMGIYAAVLGGAITLGGVAWTIRKAGEDRKAEDRKKYRPIVNFYGILEEKRINGKFLDGTAFKETPNNPFIESENTVATYTLNNLIGVNTDFAQFYISGVIINGALFYSNIKLYVNKNEFFGFNTDTIIYTQKEIKHFALIVQDLLGNEYKLPTKFEVVGINNKYIQIKDIGFACDINTEECDERF